MSKTKILFFFSSGGPDRFFIISKNVCLFHTVFDKKLVVDVIEEQFFFSSEGKSCKQAKTNAMVILKERKCCHVL